MSADKQKVATLDHLALDDMQMHLDAARAALKHLDQLGEASRENQEAARDKIAQFALALKMDKIDEDALEAFFAKPYPRLEQARDPRGRLVPDTWRLTIPRFIPLQVGYLETQDESYNYFRVNRHMDWFGEIPDFIKKQIGWKEAPELKIVGEELVGSKEELKKAVAKYPGMLRQEGDRVIINHDRAYDLVVGLLKEGVKPFGLNPVDPADVVEGRKFEFKLRPYQEEIWRTFLQRRSVGVFIPPSTGKTVIGAYAASHIKPPVLIVVPTNTLVEQWEDFLETNTDLKLGEEVVVATYQSAIRKWAAKEWTLVIFDEVHHQPAHEFIKLALLKRKYSMGLSATPYREDEGGEELIFALTGFPTGLAWQYFKELGIIKSPTCHVWIEKNVDSKQRRLAALLATPKKTIVFSDSIDYGKQVAGKFGLPFVYGDSVARIQTLRDNQTIVVSRVGDEGVSLPDIERVIEVSWLFGSRRQELQRFTRLLHGKTESQSEAHVLMTLEEYVRDKKRLFSIMEKGFKIVLHRDGMDAKTVQRMDGGEPERRPPRLRKAAKSSPAEAQEFLPNTPESVKSMPGAQAILAKLNKGDGDFFKLLLSKDGEWWARKAIPLALGLANLGNIRLGAMVSRGWVQKKMDGGEAYYRTNFMGKP